LHGTPVHGTPAADDSQHLTEGAEMRAADTSVFHGSKCRRRPDDGGVVPSSPSSSRATSASGRSRANLEACGQLAGLFFEHRRAASIRAAGASEASGAHGSTGATPPYLVERCTARARDRFRRVRWPRSPIPARSGR
jgi:hypothetical protein